MNLAQHEIKQIEQLAIELKKRAHDLSYAPPSTTKVQLTPSRRYKKVILLLGAKTNVGAKVESNFAELDQLHREYETWRGKSMNEDNEEEFTILVDSLKGALYELADTLQQIVESAGKERKRWMVKGICYGIGVLAALLTCIYLLCWLWTKFSA